MEGGGSFASVNVFNITELYFKNGWNGKFHVMYILLQFFKCAFYGMLIPRNINKCYMGAKGSSPQINWGGVGSRLKEYRFLYYRLLWAFSILVCITKYDTQCFPIAFKHGVACGFLMEPTQGNAHTRNRVSTVIDY